MVSRVVITGAWRPRRSPVLTQCLHQRAEGQVRVTDLPHSGRKAPGRASVVQRSCEQALGATKQAGPYAFATASRKTRPDVRLGEGTRPATQGDVRRGSPAKMPAYRQRAAAAGSHARGSGEPQFASRPADEAWLRAAPAPGGRKENQRCPRRVTAVASRPPGSALIDVSRVVGPPSRLMCHSQSHRRGPFSVRVRFCAPCCSSSWSSPVSRSTRPSRGGPSFCGVCSSPRHRLASSASTSWANAF